MTRSFAAAICAAAWSIVLFGVPDASVAQNVVSVFDTLSTVLEPGDRVRVIDRAGSMLTGTVVALSPSLVIRVGEVTRELPPSEIHVIERRGDPLRNGALSGLSIGLSAYAVLLGAGSALYGPPPARDLPLIAFTAAVAGGAGLGAGAAIDAMSRHWRPVYRQSATARVTVTPIFADRRRGIRLAIAF